jgi:hypothetical protein
MDPIPTGLRAAGAAEPQRVVVVEQHYDWDVAWFLRFGGRSGEAGENVTGGRYFANRMFA